MADEFRDKLNGILNNPDLMKTISSLASSMGSMQSDNIPDGLSEYSQDTPSELSSIASVINDSNDSRINLLYALKPYMRNARADQMDMAIKILRLTKITSLL